MNNPTLELSKDDYYTLILREDGNPRRVIRIMDESDASHYISSNVCLYSMTGVNKPGDELVLSSDVIVADETDETFFSGRDWRVLKQLNLTDKALELRDRDWETLLLM